MVDYAFQSERVTTSKQTLEDDTYDDVQEATGGFHGGLVQAARNKAVQACKSVVARWQEGTKASKPTLTSPHVVCDNEEEHTEMYGATGRGEFILARDTKIMVLTLSSAWNRTDHSPV